MQNLQRRALLKGIAAAALTGAAAGTATGCSHADTSKASGTISKAVLPTFASNLTVKPDLKSAFPLGVDASFGYPTDPQWAVKNPPLSGEKVTSLTYTYDPVVPGIDKNPIWQKINQRLGGELDITYTTSADYKKRLATTIAGGDLPDLVTVRWPVTQLPALLKAKFTDLNEHLAGDAIKDYPNLASLPTDAWRKTVYDGALWGIPLPASPIRAVAWTRLDLIGDTGLPTQPKNIDEFKQLLKGLTNERKSRWACGDPNATFDMITAALGIPQMWIEQDGKLTSNIELEQYLQALSDTRELVKAGVFHPDGLLASNNQHNDWFLNGTTPIVFGGYSGWSKYEMWGADVPGFKLGSILPFGYDTDTKPVHPRGEVASAFTAISQSKPDRLQDLLRVLDWLATPFGSAEELLRGYGIEHETFTFQGSDPIVNSRGQTLRVVPWQYIARPKHQIYDPGKRHVSQARFDYQEAVLAIMAPDPTLGLYSETNATKSATLNTDLSSTHNDIVTGRAPVSSWKDAVAKWRRDGGDKIRTEYEQGISKDGDTK